MSVNSIYLMGRLGKDPEVRTTQSGSKVASFTVCTGGKYKTKDGREVDDTAWHSVIAWKHHADTVERFLKKGSQVFLVGHLTYRDWTDSNDVKRTVAEIIVDKVELCGGSPQSQQTSAPAPAPTQRPVQTKPMPYPEEPDDSDLPF